MSFLGELGEAGEENDGGGFEVVGRNAAGGRAHGDVIERKREAGCKGTATFARARVVIAAHATGSRRKDAWRSDAAQRAGGSRTCSRLPL